MKTSRSGNCLLTKDNGATGTKKGKKHQLIDIQGWSVEFGLKNNKILLAILLRTLKSQQYFST